MTPPRPDTLALESVATIGESDSMARAREGGCRYTLPYGLVVGHRLVFKAPPVRSEMRRICGYDPTLRPRERAAGGACRLVDGGKLPSGLKMNRYFFAFWSAVASFA